MSTNHIISEVANTVSEVGEHFVHHTVNHLPHIAEKVLESQEVESTVETVTDVVAKAFSFIEGIFS